MSDQEALPLSPNGLPRRILIVDDDTATRRMYRFLLASSGYQVVEAVDGIAALQEMSLQQFPIVITDMNMPRMGGIELVRTIRKTYPNTHVIMVTAFGTSDTERDVRKAGADEYLAKPFDFEELERRVDTFFRARRRQTHLPR